MMNKNLQFGIFHTAYEKAGNAFFDFVDSDYINTIHVESDYGSEKFEISMNKIKSQQRVQAWIAVTPIGFEIKNDATMIDNGVETSVFNPKTKLREDYKSRVNQLIAYLKEKGYYSHVCGFYMDEPLLWNITNDMLEEYTGYFRTVAAPDKRFFICFSVAGVCPEIWTINDIQPITKKSVQYLTDIAFDMYHPWNETYDQCLKSMLDKSGNRDDLRLWMIPCTMNYRGTYQEDDAIDHLNKCYEVLKNYQCSGGLMCFTYYTFDPTEEALGNIGLQHLNNPHLTNQWPSISYWPRLIKRLKEIGKEIVAAHQQEV
ncbi:MAG: hypothetical protein ACOX3K_02410 [Bacilli bacterium]|jgi:hypothetical protein